MKEYLVATLEKLRYTVYSQLSKHYWWPGMRSDVRMYVTGGRHVLCVLLGMWDEPLSRH